MHNDRIDTDRLQQDDIRCKVACQSRIAHRMAAIFHDEGLTRITLQIGKGFGKRFRLGEIDRVDAHRQAAASSLRPIRTTSAMTNGTITADRTILAII